MSPDHPTTEWYAKVSNAGYPSEQGLVIDETTGASIAVTYDSKHAAVIAHAVNMFPKLLAALEQCITAIDLNDELEGQPKVGDYSAREYAELTAWDAARSAMNEANHPLPPL